MDLTTTVILIVVSLTIAVVCGWLGARPADPRRGVRMMPWRAMMLLAAAFALILLPHLASLLGVSLPGQN